MVEIDNLQRLSDFLTHLSCYVAAPKPIKLGQRIIYIGDTEEDRLAWITGITIDEIQIAFDFDASDRMWVDFSDVRPVPDDWFDGGPVKSADPARNADGQSGSSYPHRLRVRTPSHLGSVFGQQRRMPSVPESRYTGTV